MAVEKDKGESSSGDPARPKALFPDGTRQCPKCRSAGGAAAAAAREAGDQAAVSWDEKEVLRFLERCVREDRGPLDWIHLEGGHSLLSLAMLAYVCFIRLDLRTLYCLGAARSGAPRWTTRRRILWATTTRDLCRQAAYGVLEEAGGSGHGGNSSSDQTGGSARGGSSSGSGSSGQIGRLTGLFAEILS